MSPAMNGKNVFKLKSFWQVQLVGWSCYYLFDLLESVHQFLTRREYIHEESLPIAFMFLASFSLRPVCRYLWRRQQSWIATRLRRAVS